MSYMCSRCKREFSGKPAVENGAGIFCEVCFNFIKNKSKAKKQEKREAVRVALDGCCSWCGKKITPETMQSTTEAKKLDMCKKCKSHQRWLLKVIRASDKPALYVAKHEESARPEREAREKAMKESHVITHTVSVEDVPIKTEESLPRLAADQESLMQSVIQQLAEVVTRLAADQKETRSELHALKEDLGG